MVLHMKKNAENMVLKKSLNYFLFCSPLKL